METKNRLNLEDLSFVGNLIKNYVIGNQAEKRFEKIKSEFNSKKNEPKFQLESTLEICNIYVAYAAAYFLEKGFHDTSLFKKIDKNYNEVINYCFYHHKTSSFDLKPYFKQAVMRKDKVLDYVCSVAVTIDNILKNGLLKNEIVS